MFVTGEAVVLLGEVTLFCMETSRVTFPVKHMRAAKDFWKHGCKPCSLNFYFN